jgi:hypothetical protein
MSGYTLGQEYGHGRTFQHTVIAGVGPGAPVPEAGSSYTYTVTPWDRMRLVFCTFTLATDANAANRYVTIEYPGADGVSVVGDGAAVVVTANTIAQRYNALLNRGAGEWNTNTDVFFTLSGIWLEVGRTIVINIANVQAGDLLSKVRLTFDVTPVAGDGSEVLRAHELAAKAEAFAESLRAG